jgi:hypothetical protein
VPWISSTCSTFGNDRSKDALIEPKHMARPAEVEPARCHPLASRRPRDGPGWLWLRKCPSPCSRSSCSSYCAMLRGFWGLVLQGHVLRVVLCDGHAVVRDGGWKWRILTAGVLSRRGGEQERAEWRIERTRKWWVDASTVEGREGDGRAEGCRKYLGGVTEEFVEVGRCLSHDLQGRDGGCCSTPKPRLPPSLPSLTLSQAPLPTPADVALAPRKSKGCPRLQRFSAFNPSPSPRSGRMGGPLW